MTPYVVEQKVWISSAVPGSWPPNWLHGKPRTVKPFSPYVACSRSSPSYCGVRPHLDATLTISATWPSWSWRSASPPSSAFTSWS